MSTENVDLVRRAHQHFADTGEPMWDAVDREVEIFDFDIPDASNPYRGMKGMAQWLSDFAQSWERYEMELQRVIDVGDRVVSLFRIRAIGAGSGASVERGDAMVWTVRDGKVTRIEYFNDQPRALEAVGLRE